MNDYVNYDKCYPDTVQLTQMMFVKLIDLYEPTAEVNMNRFVNIQSAVTWYEIHSILHESSPGAQSSRFMKT